MNRLLMLASATALSLTAAPLSAQSSSNSARDAIGKLLGAVFGQQPGTTTSLDAQWIAGQKPLTNRQVAFESQVDANVRSGALTSAVATRLKYDYGQLVTLEGQYGADGRFTTTERADLTDRYGRLNQVLNDGKYGDGLTASAATVAEGQTAFNSRVDASVAARKISRTAGARLKSDYTALVGIESGYLRDGVLDANEQADLDTRLDALDVRVGDVAYATQPVFQTPKMRLDAIQRALPTISLTSAARAQLTTEYEDVARLEAAYARLSTTADERAYLEKRLVDLETDVRIRR